MSRPFPRIPRIALSLLLMAPLVWFAGCTTPPARPQAEPLPDNEVVATRTGATPRERMIEIALTEWDRWGRQEVRVGRDDTYCVTGAASRSAARPVAGARRTRCFAER